MRYYIPSLTSVQYDLLFSDKRRKTQSYNVHDDSDDQLYFTSSTILSFNNL